MRWVLSNQCSLKTEQTTSKHTQSEEDHYLQCLWFIFIISLLSSQLLNHSWIMSNKNTKGISEYDTIVLFMNAVLSCYSDQQEWIHSVGLKKLYHKYLKNSSETIKNHLTYWRKQVNLMEIRKPDCAGLLWQWLFVVLTTHFLVFGSQYYIRLWMWDGCRSSHSTIIEKGSDVLCQKIWLKNGKEQLLCADRD